MPLFLKNRQPDLIEKMDRSDVDSELLENTYRQFSTINLLLSQWKSIYKNEIKSWLSKSEENTLLDIGFGGGDVPINLSKWAKEDGFKLNITAIEIDERAYEYVQSLNSPENITFRFCSSTQILKEHQQYDFVISNHVLHHLDSTKTNKILEEAKLLARKKVIFSDIERSDIGYILFSILASFISRKSFIRADGLTSIKRSYTFDELEQMAPDDWQVKQKFPFRLLLINEKTK